MTPFILVANAGSSSLKFALFRKTDANEPVAEAAGEVEGIGTQPRHPRGATCHAGGPADRMFRYRVPHCATCRRKSVRTRLSCSI
jgi:hypothetical protein